MTELNACPEFQDSQPFVSTAMTTFPLLCWKKDSTGNTGSCRPGTLCICPKLETHGRLLRWVSQKFTHPGILKNWSTVSFQSILPYSVDQSNLRHLLSLLVKSDLRSQKDFRNISYFPLIYMGANWCPVVEVSSAYLKEEMKGKKGQN